ncbi:hypothetical protein L195_g042643, partial [Trifolium pratense]
AHPDSEEVEEPQEEQEDVEMHEAQPKPEEEEEAQPKPDEFLGLPSDESVLSLYGSHIARLLYNKHLNKLVTSYLWWFDDAIEATGLADLASTGYLFLDSALLSALAEMWHEETNSFHLSVGDVSKKNLYVEEIIVTLNDVLYLLHLTSPGPPRHHDQI